MSYKLTIIKYTDNPTYEAEMAKYKDNSEYYSRSMMDNKTMPERIKTEKSLEVVLTDTEFNAIKKAALEVFE